MGIYFSGEVSDERRICISEKSKEATAEDRFIRPRSQSVTSLAHPASDSSSPQKGSNMPPVHKQELPTIPSNQAPVFSESEAAVIFVLGGPGAGKGTQCDLLVEHYGFIHLSAGDLLRAEQSRQGSTYGDLIKEYIKEGTIVPMEVTVKLLEDAVRRELDKRDKGHQSRFLIDGFPRKMDQAVAFEQAVCPSMFTLFYDCPEETMQERLLERGKTSGRADDNAESIKKRFKTFVETSMPVVKHFEGQGKVVKVMATGTKEEVFAETKKQVEARGIKPPA